MLSSIMNPLYAGNSMMPGSYDPMQGPAAGNTPFPAIPPASSTMPSTGTPFPRIPPGPPIGGRPLGVRFPRRPAGYPATRSFMRRPPMVPSNRPLRLRRHRRRPLTPEIVIERQHRHHSSRGRHRVITVPLDSRPTLGLRGPPRCEVEIERVRSCRRRRRCRSPRYEYDHGDPPPLPPQPITIVANPIANPCLPPTQSSFVIPSNNTAAVATSRSFPNLTQEMIENLPKQTVHLPPIRLPGSQADANTEIHTVIFPTEIINPVDGSLSIIQAHPGSNGVRNPNIQSTIPIPFQPQSFNNLPTIVGTPAAFGRPQGSPAMLTDPVIQRLRERFQRMRFPQTQPRPPAPIPPMNSPPLLNISATNPANNTSNIPPTISSTNMPNNGPYLPANIQPVNPSNTAPYRPANTTSFQPANITPYHSTSFTPSALSNNATYRPINTVPSYSSDISPYRPANITSFQPASITPYRSTSFTPSALSNNATYRPINTSPSNSSDIGPYGPANITPYTNIANRYTNTSMSQPSFSSGPTPYASASSLPSTSTSTAFPTLSSPPSGIGNNSLNPSSSSPSLVSMPKSILRNGPATNVSNTTYTRLSTPNVLSSNNSVVKAARFT